MSNKIVPMVLGATIAIILTASVLMPVINDTVDDTKVYYNNGGGSYASVVDDVVNISLDLGTDRVVYAVNGVNQSLNLGGIGFVITDSFTIAGGYSNTIDVSGVDKNGNLISTARYSSIDLTLEPGRAIIDGTLTDESTVSYEFNNEWAFYRYSEGDYRVLANIGVDELTVYVNNINQVYGSNWINTTGEYFAFNGADVKVYDGESIINTNATVELSNVMNGVESFTVTSDRTVSGAFKFTVDNNGADYDVYPYYFIIPASVYGQTESNESYTALLYAIPVILLAAIVAAIALMFARRY